MKLRNVAAASAVSLALLSVPAAPSAAGLTAEGRALQLINRARVARDLPKVKRSPALDLIAERHSRLMRQRSRLFHSTDLSRTIPGSWRSWGENVAYGGTVRIMHRAFMRSPGHRRNILAQRWDQVGIGIVRGKDGRLWETQIFVDR